MKSRNKVAKSKLFACNHKLRSKSTLRVKFKAHSISQPNYRQQLQLKEKWINRNENTYWNNIKSSKSESAKRIINESKNK